VASNGQLRVSQFKSKPKGAVLNSTVLTEPKAASSENKVFLIGDRVFFAAQTSKGYTSLDLKL